MHVGTASALNVFLIRKHELKEGIEVLDGEGKVIGTSQVAAKNVSSGFKLAAKLPCMAMVCSSFIIIGSPRHCYH
jgi:hypothetical protein